MKSILTTITCVVAFLSLTLRAEEPGPSSPPPPAAIEDAMVMVGAWSDTTVSGFNLKWMADSADMLHVALSAPTTGWVAVGFKPSSMKKDANLIIGYVKADSVFIDDNFGTSAVLHEPDTSLGGTQDVGDVEGSEAEGVTRISFAIPLDSRDKYDQKLVRGERVKVILACAPNGADNFTYVHRTVASLTIEIR